MELCPALPRGRALYIYEKLSSFTILFWGAPNIWKVDFIYQFILGALYIYEKNKFYF